MENSIIAGEGGVSKGHFPLRQKVSGLKVVNHFLKNFIIFWGFLMVTMQFLQKVLKNGPLNKNTLCAQ